MATEIRRFACIDPEVVARFGNDEISFKKVKESIYLRIAEEEHHIRRYCPVEIEFSPEERQLILDNSNFLISLIGSVIKKAVQAGFQLRDQL